MKSGKDRDTFNNLTTDYNMEHNLDANLEAKELVDQYLSEGYDMRESLIKAQSYCCDMTVKDLDNQMKWAMAGIYCSIAIYRLDGDGI